VTREPDLVLGGDGHDTVEKMGDALPVDVGIDPAGRGQRRILFGIGVDEVL
jgi:hypothetical protein